MGRSLVVGADLLGNLSDGGQRSLLENLVQTHVGLALVVEAGDGLALQKRLAVGALEVVEDGGAVADGGKDSVVEVDLGRQLGELGGVAEVVDGAVASGKVDDAVLLGVDLVGGGHLGGDLGEGRVGVSQVLHLLVADVEGVQRLFVVAKGAVLRHKLDVEAGGPEGHKGVVGLGEVDTGLLSVGVEGVVVAGDCNQGFHRRRRHFGVGMRVG